MTNKLIKLLLHVVAISLLTAWPVVFVQGASDSAVGEAAAHTGVAPPSLVQVDTPAGDVEYHGVIRYIDREVIRKVTVEKPIEWQEFASLEELKTWLAEDDTNEYVYLFAGKDGIARQSDEYDCDDYALQLQRRAAASGYLMSVTIVKEQGKPHMINLVCIGNDIYYIEPQTDEVWLYCHRD